MNKSEQRIEPQRLITVTRDHLLECCPALAQQISNLTDAHLDDIAGNIEDSLDEALEMALEIMLKQQLGLPDNQ